MAITTTAIRDLCRSEEAYADCRDNRIAELDQHLGSYGGFAGAQLICEAIKWHCIRQDGYTMSEALQMMGLAA